MELRSRLIDRIVAEQQRLDRVLANIDDGLVIFDEGGRIERLNPAAAGRLALDPEEALGRRLEQVAELPQLACRVDALLSHPASAEGALELRLGTGPSAHTLECALTPFSDGRSAGVVLVVRDITEERLFERLRGEFVLRASHELRTPVTSLRMALGLLEQSLAAPPGSRERELLDAVAGDMDRLLQLIENLLDLSRLYARTRALDCQPVAATELLQQAVARFADQARRQGVRLGLDCAASLPSLCVDRGLLDRVLDNLLGNALRNTPPEGAVTLSCRPGPDPGRLAIEVSDSGPGIPDLNATRVFEPFVQVGGRTGGAGLGLAMCREIVEQHEGRINVRSRPGHGSRFTVELPAPSGGAGAS